MGAQRRAWVGGPATAAMFTAVVVAVLAVMWAGPVSAVPSGDSEASAARSGSLGTNGAEAPQIDWGSCPGGIAPAPYECATVRVPLTYQKPDGRKIELALGRLPAADQERKIGTLFWNPGGPGGSGRLPRAYSPALLERFDIVGFDPRGTNASTPLKCFKSTRQAAATFGRPFPITLAQEGPFFDANERGTDLCDRNAGPIISHMSTANVARDMDLLRQAVGDDRMNFLGYSYGTHLGEVYANLFPKKVRAMVLDAVLDPKEWTTGEESGDALTEPFTYRLGSFDGAQDALESFLRECADARNCAFGERGADVRELRTKYETILKRLREGPVKVTGGGQITYQYAVGFTLSRLYAAGNAPQLANFLQDLHKATEDGGGRAAPEVDVPDVPVWPTFERPQDRDRRQGPYAGIEWFNAVSCADTENPRPQNSWSLYARQADERAPGFGSLWTYLSTPCATWPVEDPDRYAGPWNKQTSNPILLIGNRQGDPATPYDDARTTANERLADGRLLTLNSFGHTAAYGGQSRCIDAAVDRYLIGGALPPKGKVCQPNRQPFGGARSDADETVPAEPAPPSF